MKQATVSTPSVELAPDFPATLSAYIDKQLDHWPQGRFIEIDAAGHAEETPYAQLHERSQRILSILRSTGITADVTVVLLFARASDHISATWACIYGGFTWVPWSFDTRAGSEKEFISGLKDLTGNFDSTVILTCSTIEDHLDSWPGLPTECRILNIDTNCDATTLIDAHIGQQYDQEPGCCLVSTSGTTAIPKLARIPQQVLLSRYAVNLNISRCVNTLHFAPLHSISSFRMVLPVSDFTVYMHPARVATHPQDVFHQIEAQKIEFIPLISSQLAALLIHTYENSSVKANFSSLNRIAFGSDFILPSLVSRLIQYLQINQAGSLDVAYAYGMTECGPVCLGILTDSQRVEKTLNTLQAVEIGAPVAGWHLRVTGESGVLLEENQPGYIEVWSDCKLFSGYLHDTVKKDSSFLQDGWFRTGDMGLLIDGRLTITGRESTKIIVASGNLSLQQIEAGICGLPGLFQSLLMAIPVRAVGDLSDEVVILFVPDTADKKLINDLCRRITRKLTESQRIRVKHLVAVSADDFQRTATGKIKRKQMQRRYFQGEWLPIKLDCLEEENSERNEVKGFLLRKWKCLLKLDQLPPVDVSFFSLGGDSLSSAVLITEVEQRFGCELPLADFYQDPTINRLQMLLEKENRHVTPPEDFPAGAETDAGVDMLHRIESYVASWKGSRRFEGSLIVGKNTSGKKRPLFFVFQGELEFKALAKRLGTNQPVYGMRSLANILPVREYTADKIEALVNCYLQEFMEMSLEQPVFLGGHCQGGIIALALAKKLKQMNRAPALLVLMEWSYSFGKYDNSVLLIYGRKSYTTGIFSAGNKGGIDWKGDFPNCTVTSVSGNHSNFLQRFSLLQIIFILKQQFILHDFRNRDYLFPWRRRQAN